MSHPFIKRAHRPWNTTFLEPALEQNTITIPQSSTTTATSLNILPENRILLGGFLCLQNLSFTTFTTVEESSDGI